MKFFLFSVNRSLKPVFSLFLANFIFLLGFLIADPGHSLTVNASPDSPAPISTPVNLSPASPVTPWQKLSTQTEQSFAKSRTKIETAIADLNHQLEQIATSSDPIQQKQLKKDLEKRQDILENAADKLDDLAEKLEDVSPKLLKAKDLSPEELSQRQASVQNTLNTLNQLVTAVNSLAENTEQAKKQNTPEFRTQIEQQSQELSQLLEQTQQTLKGFTSGV
jgi:methyl-accepting chemotaxis protein